MLKLPYGTDASLPLEFSDQAKVAHCDAPRGEAIRQISQAVRQALESPLEFPPLAQAAVPGDRVVLALEPGVPQAAAIVAETVRQLESVGVAACDISLVRSAADVASGVEPLDQLPAAARDAVVCQVHDPLDRDALSYLAATDDGRPIYVNRAIHDADLVIPIGVLRLADAWHYHGINSALFPAFSDAANLARYGSPEAALPGQRAALQDEADEFGWLLGLQFTIQVVPGAAGQALHVLAGDLQSVFREGSRLCQSAWRYPVDERAELVVAAIDGDATQQTWTNVGRALAAAARALDDDGSVVLCTELAETVGGALAQLVGADDLDRALDAISRHPDSDTAAAGELARALQRGRVYLVSQLEDDTVEDLGVLPVDESGAARVARRAKSCIVLAAAQYAQARPPGEPAELPAPSREWSP